MNYLPTPGFGTFFPGQYQPSFFANQAKTIDRDKEMYKAIPVQTESRQPAAKYIILADDDADDRDLFSDAMGEIKSKVKLEMVEDGRSLMDILRIARSLPDMIFLDLNMPDKNGRECLDEIRQSEKLKKIPIIIYSTSSSTKDVDETFERGANLYVRKPNTFRELLLLAEKILSLNWDHYKPMSSRNKYVFSSK